MTGAARLAARAAQRMGAGLVTLAAPRAALPIYAEALESVIVRPCDTAEEWQALVGDARQPAILIGPGLGTLCAEEVLATLSAERPTVVDADGLTAFAENPEALISALHSQSVLTPHEGEFARVLVDLTLPVPLRKWVGGGGATLAPDSQEHPLLNSPLPNPSPRGGGEDKVCRALAAAKRAGCVVLLKGAETVIASPDGIVVINRNAPPWLATAGAGDVLAGMILGLVAQKMPVFWASAAAVWMHGQIAAIHGAGLIAEDIVEGIPRVLTEILNISDNA